MANTPNRKRKYLWRIVIFIVVAVGLAALTIPNYVTGRCGTPNAACINNLRQIDGAKEQWALENHQPKGSPAIVEEINKYIKGGQPKCPQGGVYIYGNIDEPPRCTVKDHILP